MADSFRNSQIALYHATKPNSPTRKMYASAEEFANEQVRRKMAIQDHRNNPMLAEEQGRLRALMQVQHATSGSRRLIGGKTKKRTKRRNKRTVKKRVS